jgi:hypothetical protein
VRSRIGIESAFSKSYHNYELPMVILFLIVLCVPVFGAVRPEEALAILEKRCIQCHGEKVGLSGLRLTSRENLLKGGAHGPSIKPGSASQSRLWQAVSGAIKPSMPPTGKLPDDEVAVLREWIDQGAPWVVGITPTAQSDWWAFQTAVKPAVPKIPGAEYPAEYPIDAFILARLQSANVNPSPEASRLALLRRASYDLHGLPPTPELVKAFLSDNSANAWEKLIDQLLDSPRYGERWGRHWLDLVRYGDTSGFEQDPYILEAWRYRDYVIQSFNEDKPYDRFVKEQLAGDELWPDDPVARTGTGFYRVGPNRDMLFKVEDLNRVEKLTDYVETTSSVFLGLTVGCARCHDHKFDPISQRDFYRMQAIFAPAVNDRVFLDYNPARFFDIAENYRTFKLRQIGDTIERIFKPHRERIRFAKLAFYPEEVRVAFKTPEDKRSAEQQALVTTYQDKARVTDDEIRAELSQGDNERLQAVEKQLITMFVGYAPPPMAPGITDLGREGPKTFIAVRGNWEVPGDEVQPGFPACLGGGDIPEPAVHARTTFRRKALAEWIARPENPLTARVMANRIWQFHFGNGLVGTPSDFGTRAGRPSHPELLDWLAHEFIERKWSIKAMHRLIMTSATYRRSANPSKRVRERDPNNQLFSHFNRRRLSAEELRDAVLQVSGTLNLKMGGVPVVPPLNSEELYGIIGRPADAWYVTANPEEHTRRSVYLISRRTFQQPMFAAFDAPEGIISCARRESSTSATQSLTLLNGRFMIEQSRALPEKIRDVDEIWWRVLGRAPTHEENEEAVRFLERQGALLGSERQALVEVARALMNVNEFLYID